MKKALSLMLVVLVVLSAFICTACSSKPAAPAADATEASTAVTVKPREDGSKPVVGIVVKVLTGNSFQIDLAKALEASAVKYGFDYETHAPQTFGDFSQQIEIVEDLITKGVDLIVIAPSHETAVTPSLLKAMEAGIPVVTIDTMLEDPNASIAYIGPDNVQAAYQCTKYICELMGGKGKFLHIEGDVGYAVTDWRKEGCLKALAEYPEIELVASQNGFWSTEGGMKVMENALQANPDIAGVFAANDDAALGAIEACKNAGVRPFIGGFDAIANGCQAIADGKMDATVAFFPDTMADASFRVGAAYINFLNDGQLSYFKDWIDSGATVITPDNLDLVK